MRIKLVLMILRVNKIGSPKKARHFADVCEFRLEIIINHNNLFTRCCFLALNLVINQSVHHVRKLRRNFKLSMSIGKIFSSIELKIQNLICLLIKTPDQCIAINY